MPDSNISTRNIWPYYAKNNIQNAGKAEEKGKLGKDEFLKILMTQLRNQDPTQPLQDKEFIAQMAQFTSVEQLTKMSSEMKMFRQLPGFASSLIGKKVTYTYVDKNNKSVVKTGTLESILMKKDEQYAKINGDEVKMDQISQISNPEGTP
ncbi:flagellar hook capping protein [Paenibacillus sp. MZ04-78.2]|uniref:flagellar hook capping FlgD N-terminal domain-containing protein n=1 Tax=Paenibacillus sp. MZ04-78.2 TaxID=2962034 RepID=UPI0020B7822A|nr:flagellar hook capping FlgD N-terminal domain-containing protein [Paenibacillus sp. MZ04-78.2]MCP3772802.1 flagellar hook capping protein [Paenibacillus sp. MZ04-78.2]